MLVFVFFRYLKWQSIALISMSLLSLNVFAAQPRLVVLNPYTVEMLFEIGAGHMIIGTVDYADYPQAAMQIPRVGRHNYIDYEALLLLEPDFVTIDSSFTSPQLVNRLQQLGFKLIDTHVDHLLQIPQRLRQLGELTDTQQQANIVADKLSHELSQLTQQYQQRTPVKVFFQIWPEPLTTSASSWLNEIIAGCGGINVFANSASAYPQVSTEQVLIAAPEVIIKPIHGDSKQISNEWQAWPELAAVAHHQIYNINGDLVHRTGPRVFSGMAQVCQIIDAARLQQQQRLL